MVGEISNSFLLNAQVIPSQNQAGVNAVQNQNSQAVAAIEAQARQSVEAQLAAANSIESSVSLNAIRPVGAPVEIQFTEAQDATSALTQQLAEIASDRREAADNEAFEARASDNVQRDALGESDISERSSLSLERLARANDAFEEAQRLATNLSGDNNSTAAEEQQQNIFQGVDLVA